MKVYFYNKDTYEYIRSAEANIDPLETQLKGGNVYLLPANATFMEVPTLRDNEIAIFDKGNGKWVIKTSYKGNYKLNKRTGIISVISDNSLLKSYEILIPKDIAEDYKKNPIKYAEVDGQLVDISKTQKYQNAYNIRLYKKKIRETKDKYDTFLETPVTFKGMEFLPRYIEDFNKLESRDFPITIWDSTGLKSRTMNKQEFNELKKYLENLVDKAYQEKKKRICKYMIEIGKLEDK